MSWRDELTSDDDLARIVAIDQAALAGGPELIGTMLDLALHDTIEVQTVGGVAEVWEVVGDAAARALTSILHRQGGTDERIRAAAFDLDLDDSRVSLVVRFLGAGYEEVRRELETSGEERLRIRALRSVRPFDRPPELSLRFLADPSPAVRVEALAGSARLPVAAIERALTDPVVAVRLAAAKKLEPVADSEAVVAAAQAETDPEVRDLLAERLLRYELTDRVRSVLRSYLINDLGNVDTRVAGRLQRAGDTAVSYVIAARCLNDIPEQQLIWIVQNKLLLEHVPEVRTLAEYLHRHAPANYLRHVTSNASEATRLSADEGERRAELLRFSQRFFTAQVRAGLVPAGPAPWNPLLLLGPEALRVRSVALRLREPVPLAVRFRSKEPASLYVDCPGCGEPVQVMGDVDWLYHDDDRLAESEDGFGGTLTGDCPACGCSARAEVRLSQTTPRFTTSHELTWDAVI